MSSLATSLIAVLALCASSPETAPATPRPETALIVVGSDTIAAEVADEYSERVKGLQNRAEVPEGTGMLFVWPEPAEQSFWMSDTYVDLDIAFIDTSLRIVKTATMRAGSRDTVESGVPVIFALEVRAGWFEEHGVAEGDVVEIVFDPPPGG